MNDGKQFEQDFRNSIPKDVYCYRLADHAEGFLPKERGRLKFTVQNPCDFFLYNPENKTMFALELKTTKHTSITFWREDFEIEDKDRKYMVRKNQILGLEKISKYNIISGFLINFRTTKHTYFWDIEDYLEFTNNTKKKSFNEADVVLNGGFKIEQKLLRKNYRYDLSEFLRFCYV